jgi:hypothetical protein
MISTYLEPAEAARLRESAAAGDRSVAAEIRRALRAYYFLKDETPAPTPGLRETSTARLRRHEPT